MAINLPSTSLEIEQRSKTDVQRDLVGSNPFLKNSILGALVTSNANRVFDFYGQLDILQGLLMPDTAVDEFLERWAAIYGIQRLAATQATGSFVAGGTAGATIPSGTLFASSSGEIYESTALATIAANSISVSSITRSGTTATVTCATEHGLATNINPTISGANETEYNQVGFDIISITDEFIFTYEVTGSPTTPATGTITLSHNSIEVPAESQNFQDSANGVDVNLENGDTVDLQSPIVNVDDTLGVGAIGMGGGTDQETNALLSARFLDRIQNPVANFNVAAIESKAKEIAGVTRVFVQEVTPAVGQVTIYFMRDNDASPIPSAGEVTTVKNKILEIKPANTADADVIVSAPTEVSTNFTFSSLTPNTVTMQAAITANLQQFFEEETEIGTNIQEDAYRATIQNTIDTANGDRVTDFTLSTPLTDITIASGEIGTLGTVTYP